jgi:hypothetical protein
LGEHAREDRRIKLAQFSQGDIDVVTNCNVLTEGFDEPRVDAIIMPRPTRSKLLYAQMVGRGTRRHPDKKNLAIIDIADNSKTHHLSGLNDLFNLPSRLNLKGSDALKTEQVIEALTDRYPWIDVSRIHTPDDLKVAAEVSTSGTSIRLPNWPTSLPILGMLFPEVINCSCRTASHSASSPTYSTHGAYASSLPAQGRHPSTVSLSSNPRSISPTISLVPNAAIQNDSSHVTRAGVALFRPRDRSESLSGTESLCRPS